MKNITILMVTIAALLLASCKKDENTTPNGEVISPVINNGFRLVEIKSKYYSSKIEYNKNNKVKQSVATYYSYNGEESTRKSELSYNGNEITEKVYKEENGVWVQNDDISKMIIENGLLKESIYTYTYNNGQNEVEEENTIKYSYDGKYLVAKEHHSKTSESKEVNVEKYEYKYKDGKFVEVLKFHNGTKTSKELLVYNEDKIEKIERYHYNTETKEFVKSDDEKRYTYLGNNVSKVEYWHGEELYGSKEYKYDGNGNLIEEANKYKEEEDITSYKYEKGNGNGYIMNDPEDYIFKIPLPH